MPLSEVVYVAAVLALSVFTIGSGAASTHHTAYEMRIAKILAARGQNFRLRVVYPLIRIPGRESKDYLSYSQLFSLPLWTFSENHKLITGVNLMQPKLLMKIWTGKH